MRIAFILITIIAFVFSGINPVSGKDPAEVEYKLKAAYLLNFAKFIAWPADINQPGAFPICIYGEDPFGSALKGVEKKSIKGKPITIQFSGDGSVPGSCRIVFVSRSEIGKVDHILQKVNGKPIVLVSDLEGFASQGGTVEFIWMDNKLRFIINNSQAKQNGIKITASLLKLAVEVL